MLNNDSSLNKTFCAECTEKPALIFSTFSIVIALLAFVGNMFVVLIVTRVHRMQTCTNWLILNLAIADLAFSVIAIPLEIPLELNGEWIYSGFFCHIFYPFQTCLIYGSVFTLVSLSLSRYWAVIHPFRKQLNIAGAKVVIFCIWICSFLASLPYALALKFSDDNKTCQENWSTDDSFTYTVAIFLFQYVIPLIVILITYTRIVYDLCYKENQTASRNDIVRKSETKKVVKLLIIITATFAVCLLPYHVVGLYHVANPTKSLSQYLTDASYLILYLNSALNPIIYNIFNEKFRNSFHEILNKIFCPSKQSSQVNTSLLHNQSVNSAKNDDSFQSSDEFKDCVVNDNMCIEKSVPMNAV